ncbi:MAG: phosphoribosylamine--glycine ligase [Oscillospiraceae bacterium]|nr:phosphoribosylamine--glycine ligase [Oscillospiraceae bacterium]MDD4412955.1 phosphoribosylamine--glycine ligase [Oscillospiraceae bacterium]
MDILVVGGGGREHAIIRKLKESPKCGKIYCTPGNGGILSDAKCFDVKADDITGVVELSKSLKVDLVFVAPDNPLVAGMVDALEKEGIAAFGPRANAAELEGSKVFSKWLMKKYNIPTADYKVFDNPADALTHIRKQGRYPTVIKADGLALGKGVLLCDSYSEAKAAVKSIMEDRVFGAAGNRVVVEEFLTGPEVSVLAFTDGKTIFPMVSAKDHKRVFDGDMGPNTGGMGAISPNPHYDDETAYYCMNKIFLPTVEAMNKEGRPFKGCLFFGLMLTPDGPKVIEYNCRFGDPETQVVLPRLKTDLLEIICAIREERLSELNIEWSQDACACVVMASGGYPGEYKKGVEITGLNLNGQLDDVVIFHAGTSKSNGKYYTNGGRVLGITAKGESLDAALELAYGAVARISFKDAHFRRDIGKTAAQ